MISKTGSPRICYMVITYLSNHHNMATRGANVERKSVSDQPHEIKYEAHKEGVSAEEVRNAKKSAGNQRKNIEKKV
jgi:hypothetical protein